MDDAVAERLVLSLLEWVANGERSYEEVMDAWRKSCPGLPVLGGMRMIAGLSEQRM
jgi:D-3-phosphoglycerate dehydrogenase